MKPWSRDWVDWDGAVDWWNRVRWVSLRPVEDGPGFRAACLERLRSMRHVVFEEPESASLATLVYFCESARSARALRGEQVCAVTRTGAVIRGALPQWAAPWLLLYPSAEVSLSFEESLDSPARQEFVLWCLQQARCQLRFEP